MPEIDVTDLLTDPDFCETVTVTRQATTVGANGRASDATTTFTMTAVVTSIDGDMVRQEDSEYAKTAIMVHSKTRLLGVTTGGHSDIVTWAGNRYIVKRPNNWSHFGQGFFATTCEMIDTKVASSG